MVAQTRIDEAERIMLDFARDTGLTDSARAPRRYLWTDAHAVCSFLGLHRHTDDTRYLGLAKRLVDQVHYVLGRHREDDARDGWISGLDEEHGREHPTIGGLRIGKKMPERRRDEALDERLEWDRDGQYFHYLTKWMHALYCTSRASGDARYCVWAKELAAAAQEAFAVTHGPGGEQRLLWKMSIDLSYPLVPSSGLHDPMDGYLTCQELGLCDALPAQRLAAPDLRAAIAATEGMLAGQQWFTEDALGIGGLLFDACRAVQLLAVGRLQQPQLVAKLLDAAQQSLQLFAKRSPLRLEPGHRLAFRELGLAIGLRGLPVMHDIVQRDHDSFTDNVPSLLDDLRQHVGLGDAIETFWLVPENREVATWRDHRDINAVMLATRLVPECFLVL